MQRLRKVTAGWRVLIVLFAGVLLAGCGATGFSPETVAVNSIVNQTSDMAVDQSSVRVLQTLRMGDNRVYVLVFFQGTGKEAGQMSCLYNQQVDRWQLGWRMGNGGGGCAGGAGGPETDIWSGAGMSSNGKIDPGSSQAYGMVYNPEITRVRVTWADEQVAEAAVIQSSYLVARSGQVQVKNVQGLNDAGEVIYDQTPVTAPGKQ